ncbi:MAG: hypothetical protein NTX52_00810 [Planctomycetota bacterium]|nr:hypothetical protein [Planctomycetota bacterium]
MKRILLTLAVCALMATPAWANFTFDQAQLLSLTNLAPAAPAGPTGVIGDPLAIVTADHTLVAGFYPAYDGDSSFVGNVGYVGSRTHADTVYIGTNNAVVLAAAIADGTYSLQIHNDNDDNWTYWLKTSAGISASQTLATGSTGYFSMPVAAGITDIGFVIQNAKVEGGSDVYHTSITVPAPGAILLGSIGVAFVGWLRRRRTL